MDELYGNETTSSSEELEVRYEKELADAERKQKSESSDKDPDRNHFRHFDFYIKETFPNQIVNNLGAGHEFNCWSKIWKTKKYL